MSPGRLLRTLGFALVYALLGWLGQRDTVGAAHLPILWPAAGVGVLWLLGRRTRWTAVDAVLLAAISVAVHLAGHHGTPLSLVLSADDLVQAVLGAELLRRTCGNLWGCGGDEPLVEIRSLARLLFVLLVAGVDGTAVGVVGAVLLHTSSSPVDLALWLAGALSGLGSMVVLGLVMGYVVDHRGNPRSTEMVRLGPGGSLELVALLVLTATLYSLSFYHHGPPMAFPLLSVTIWAGTRFSPPVSVLHSLGCGLAALLLTIAGEGPFVRASSPPEGAMLAHVFVLMLLITGLALSIGRIERQHLSHELGAAQDEADFQSDLMGKILDSMTEGLVVIQEDGASLLHNPAARTALGLDPDEPTPRFGDVATYAVDGSLIEGDHRPSLRALAGEVVINNELLVRDVRNHDRILSVSAAPLPIDPVTGLRRAVLLFHDVTDERAQQAELARFAGVVAHDLMGPLASIEGWANVVGEELGSADRITPETAGEFAARVRLSAQRMRSLIRDLLAHATSGDKELHLQSVDVAQVVADVLASRGSTDEVTLTPIPRVHADPLLLRQLLDNLIGNAIKYVAPGVAPRVVIAGRRTEDQVRISIADNGIGLPEGEAEHIFEEFHRAHREEYSGSGLGLAICRRIVERHGGRIGVRPNPKGGTVFEFTLPAAP